MQDPAIVAPYAAAAAAATGQRSHLHRHTHTQEPNCYTMHHTNTKPTTKARPCTTVTLATHANDTSQPHVLSSAPASSITAAAPLLLLGIRTCQPPPLTTTARASCCERACIAAMYRICSIKLEGREQERAVEQV